MFRLRTFAFFITSAALLAIGRAQVVYQVTDLGVLSGDNTSGALALNASGQIVGFSENNVTPADHAFIWSPLGGMQSLGTLNSDPSSIARGINNNGDVAGFSADNVFNPVPLGHAFEWNAASGLQPITPLSGDTYNTAMAINDHGDITGASYGAGITHAYLMTRHGFFKPAVVQDISYPGVDTFPRAINQRAQVAGWLGGSVKQAFLWDQHGGYTLIPHIAGFYERAFGLNNASQVVGQFSDGTTLKPFFWSNRTGAIDLGLLPGTDHGVATAINDLGVVVGWCADSGNNYPRAFMWTAAGGMQDLNNSLAPSTAAGTVWRDAQAIDINGNIVGSITLPNGGIDAALFTATGAQ